MPGSTLMVRDLVHPQLPEMISYMPQTIGWKLLFISLMGFIFYKAYCFISRYLANRYRREGLKQLQQLSNQPHLVVHGVNQILKHAACYAYSHTKIAGLVDGKWLVFLSENSDAEFNNELGLRWQQALFNPNLLSQISPQEITQLKQLTKSWLITHREGDCDDV